MQRSTNRARFNRNACHQNMEVNKLREEVRNLTEMLESERSHRCHLEDQQLLLSQELEETKEQLVRQKGLKEMYINRGKETKRELEMLLKYSSEETLSKHRIAQKVRDTNRQKKKKHLHADYEELQVAHLVDSEKLNAELKEGEDKIKVLQEELQRTSVLNQELSLRYDADVQTAKLQVESLQQELQQQLQAHAERASQDQQVILSLRAEQDLLLQKVNEEVSALQLSAFEKEMLFVNELEELKTKLQIKEANKELVGDNKTVQNFWAELQEEKNRSWLLQQELEQLKVVNQELHQRHGTDLQTLKHQAESQQQELQAEIKSLNDKITDDQLEIWSTKTEISELREKMEEEIRVLKQTSLEKESSYCRELDELRSQCASLVSKNNQLSSELQARREEKPEEEEEAMETNTIEVEESAGPSGTNGPDETSGPEEPAETAASTPSVWKKTRHFLGLRKPQRWKK